MALFSPETMALLPVVDNLGVSSHYGGEEVKKVFHYKGGLGPLMDALKADYPMLAEYAKNGSSWAGCLNGETTKSMIETAHCETAFKEYQKSTAGLVRPLTRGKPELSVIGGSFSVGRLEIGHPVSCYRRPKKKLPAQRLEFSISVSAGTNHADVTREFSKIIVAANRYHLAGGIVSLTVHYFLGFQKKNPETGARGIVVSLVIPLNSASLAAFSGSIQFFRAVLIPMAQALSGVRHDSLTVLRFTDPKRAIGIHGYAQDAAASVAALKVEET